MEADLKYNFPVSMWLHSGMKMKMFFDQHSVNCTHCWMNA